MKKPKTKQQVPNIWQPPTEYGMGRFLLYVSPLLLVFIPGMDHFFSQLTHIQAVWTYILYGMVIVLGVFSYKKIHDGRMYLLALHLGSVLIHWQASGLGLGQHAALWSLVLGLGLLTPLCVRPSFNYGLLQIMALMQLVVVHATLYGYQAIPGLSQYYPGLIGLGVFYLLALVAAIKVFRGGQAIFALWLSVGVLAFLPLFINKMTLVFGAYPGALGLKQGVYILQNLPILATLIFALALIGHWWSHLHHQIAFDPLLRIYNRDYCQKILSQKNPLYRTSPFTLAMVDIDHFKKVNDTHGHQAGDAVLVEVAQHVWKCVGRKGVVCRYGGEELIVFLPGRYLKESLVLLELIRSTIEKKVIPFAGKKIKVTVSQGVTQREKKSQTLEQLLEAADTALYRAKKGGRNQVRAGRIKTME